MIRRFRHPAAAVLVAVWLAVSLSLFVSFDRSAAAQRVSVQVIKGFVTARTHASIMVLVGKAAIRVSIDASARIKGQRTMWEQIAVNDVVRVEGRMIARDHLRAREIDVVLAAGTLVVGRQAAHGIVSGIWSWLLNGGPTISLP